jgi:hypothetical protein
MKREKLNICSTKYFREIQQSASKNFPTNISTKKFKISQNLIEVQGKTK